jgi:hypothetical protein
MLKIKNELKGCDFKDERLTKRAMLLATVLSENPELSIHTACGSAIESKAAYRFFQNQNVVPDIILSGHIKNTIDRVNKTAKDILVIQDTTDLIYTQFPSTQGLGEVNKSEGYANAVKGIKLHNSIAVSMDGVPLGLLRQSFFTHEDYKSKRGQVGKNTVGMNKKIPIEQKESFRWIEHFKKTNELLGFDNRRIIHVADRECDIFEFLFEVETAKSLYVIRSSRDRISNGTRHSKNQCTIQKQLDSAQSIGTISVVKDNISIDCNIKYISANIIPPQRLPEAKSMVLMPIKVNVVEVKSLEKSNNLHWRILTNLPVDNFEEALTVVSIYKRRWAVECFHRILKSGFSIEKARLKNRFRIENLASILSIAAWYIFWLYSFARVHPNLLAQKICDSLTIKILKISAKKLKVDIKGKFNIEKAILIIARLGGFSARQSDGEPGMMSIWRGWGKLNERLEFYEEMNCG